MLKRNFNSFKNYYKLSKMSRKYNISETILKDSLIVVVDIKRLGKNSN